ncbi:MAG: tripartite tricarboxylate transporter substrate binding protein, partial [Burkholderiales bacterium]
MATRTASKVMVVGIVALLLIGASAASAAAAAASYPNRPMEYVIPFGPGGGTDLTLRLYKDKVEKILGQPIVMTYKPGAGGVVAGGYVMTTKPDGHTIFTISNTSLVTSILARKASFTLDDFAPVCTLTLTTTMLVVKRESPYKTLKDFIEAAKSQKMTFSTTAAFSAAHFIIEAIGRQEGFQAKAVAMGGGAKAMLAVLGGHVDMAAVSATGIENQLRILAVNTTERWPYHPEVPTLRELG